MQNPEELLLGFFRLLVLLCKQCMLIALGCGANLGGEMEGKEVELKGKNEMKVIMIMNQRMMMIWCVNIVWL